MKDFLTDEQVELEVEKLKNSKAVKLARLEQRLKYRKRQYLYTLRQLEKRGKQLMDNGLTEEKLKSLESEMEI